MLKKYKNQLLYALKEKGYDPIDFNTDESLSTNPVSSVSTYHFLIRYKQTRLSFKIWESREDVHTFSFEYRSFSKKQQIGSGVKPIDFPALRSQFISWLMNDVREYIEEENTPDLWNQINEYRSLANNEIIRLQDTSNFTEDQQRHIQTALAEFQKQIVVNFNPTQQQLQEIEQRLTYLSEATSRLNRFDWQGLVISTLLGIMITLSLDTARGQQLYELFMQALQSVQHMLSQ
ncbi:MAG: hypothetical protein OHK0022_14460 [Roseiflexaceae bacterium]